MSSEIFKWTELKTVLWWLSFSSDLYQEILEKTKTNNEIVLQTNMYIYLYTVFKHNFEALMLFGTTTQSALSRVTSPIQIADTKHNQLMNRDAS